MVFDTQKETYYGMYLTDWTYSWGGRSYNNYLMTEFVDENLRYNSTTDADDIRYLLPYAPGNVYVIDGWCEGFFTVYNADGSNSTTFDSYDVYLKKTEDAADSEETLGTMSVSPDDTVNIESYGTYPIYFDVDEQSVSEGELLLLHLNMSFTDGDLEWSHANDSSNVDLEIKIPILG